MTSLDLGHGVRTALTRLREAKSRLRAAWEWYDAIPPVRRIHAALGRVGDGWRRMSRWLNSVMPKGLYARALLIIIAPMVILQSVIAFVFMERHWSLVTQRLSANVVNDIGALIDVYRSYPQDAEQAKLRKIAQGRLGLVVDFLPIGDMPPPGPKPFFSLLDQALSVELRKLGHPFWIDTVGKSALVEIRVQLDKTVMRVFARRSAAYASNSEIFLIWMVGTSTVLLIVAIIFLRNQIKPILRLADAAESFGKGRDVPNFRPRGAREVRRAAQAFIEMKTRVERMMEQRTAMLAGVSHDLRTVLTRFKLELALIGDSPEAEAMKKDVDEMARMLEAYLAFARGDLGESAAPTDMAEFLEELRADAERHGHRTTVVFHGTPIVTVRPAAFKRCLANLVSNAARHGDAIAIAGQRDHRYLTVTIDDDGPGIPPGMREEVFKPFLRLDDARNQDEGGTGLGLAIARDIARSHGGDITLGDSPLGGLRATVRVPV
jgi:two-component system osmolarity sensor histidine kinase EnvZ